MSGNGTGRGHKMSALRTPKTKYRLRLPSHGGVKRGVKRSEYPVIVFLAVWRSDYLSILLLYTSRQPRVGHVTNAKYSGCQDAKIKYGAI